MLKTKLPKICCGGTDEGSALLVEIEVGVLGVHGLSEKNMMLERPQLDMFVEVTFKKQLVIGVPHYGRDLVWCLSAVTQRWPMIFIFCCDWSVSISYNDQVAMNSPGSKYSI